MRRVGFPPILVLGVLSLLAVVCAPDQAKSHVPGATVDDLLAPEVGPFAIAHRGFGDNLGEDPSRPIEETLSAVRSGFRAGASVVEVDVQRTADGEVVAYHDDFLPDYTCIHRLTLGELRERLPHVTTLHAILLQARSFNTRGSLQGLVIVELKAPSPLCDPDDTQEHAIVTSVAAVIRRADMTNQVILTSLSPVLLFLAKAHIPEVVRSLTIDGLQFLGPDEIQAAVSARIGDLTVTPIDKRPDFGLRWAEIGALLRLPGYRSVQQMIATAVLVDARVVEADLILLGAAGAPLVDLLHSVGLKVLGYTVNDADEWQLLESLGVDGIYTNDVPLGVELQATLSSPGQPGRAVLRPRAESRERKAG